MNRFLTGSFIGALGVALITAPLMVQAQNNGNTVQAPFVVLGASGDPILKVSESDGGALLTLYGPTGTGVELAATAAATNVTLAAGNRHLVNLIASGNEVSVNLSIGDRLSRMVTNASEQSITMERGGVKVVDLGTKSANAALRIASPSGAMVAQIGSNQGNGGAGAVYVNDTGGKTTGYMVSLANNEGVVGVSLNGQEVAKLEANATKSGGKISIADTNGNLAFNAGLNSASEGTACVYNKSGQQCF